MVPTNPKKIIFILIFCFLPLSPTKASIIINEIAWMGDTTFYNHEWLELFNDGATSLDLSGWILKTADDKIKISLTGSIPSKGFFLLEKSSDASVKDLPADLIYQGALKNTGEKIQLFNPQNELVDEIDNLAGWVGGDNKTKQTLARANGQWCTSEAIGGTPKATNQCLIKNPEPLLPASSTPATKPIPSNSPLATTSQAPKEIKNVFINEILPSPEGPDT
ncbi:MAG: lamin tail domain-containing protein, partial [Candidatus Gribaldobacteria bacterium]|nr:lamin tail domain-containing protein [Candidatus Gribaldobacteria bacterium]